MGIADSFRQLAEKAKAKMAASEGTTSDEDTAMTRDRYGNAPGDRFGRASERGQEAMNERTDDFTGGQRGGRRDRDNDLDL